MKTPKYPYSPELKAPMDTSGVDYDAPNMAKGMRTSGTFMRLMTKLHRTKGNVSRRRSSYSSYDGAEISFFVMEPQNTADKNLPCIIYYHGGGFMFPIQPMMLNVGAYLSKTVPCRVLIPEFRLSLENSCKDILEDCFAMYQYAFAHADALRIDPKQIIVYGDSAGGALAAAVTHMARDRNATKAKGQMLVYPVIDNHSERYASMEKFKDAAWPANANRWMWKQLFARGTDGMENYAAPINMDDFTGLPMAYMEPQEIDILCDEAIAYAHKLKDAGSLLELNVIKGSYHGFEGDWKSPLTQRVLAHRGEVINRMMIG